MASIWFVIACAAVLAFNAYVADLLTRIRADIVVIRRGVLSLSGTGGRTGDDESSSNRRKRSKADMRSGHPPPHPLDQEGGLDHEDANGSRTAGGASSHTNNEDGPLKYRALHYNT